LGGLNLLGTIWTYLAAMLKRVLVASLFGIGSAQLLVEPHVEDLEKFMEEQKMLQQSEPVEGAEPQLQEPTLCDPTVKQHSGLLDAGNSTKYFFWLFESRATPTTDPLVIWLTGGPGCSSQLALLAENGPCSVSADGKSTVPNPKSWNSNANVLWLDQPQSTGFSTGPLKISSTEDDTAEHFYTFLMNFYKAYPQYKQNDLFISGESYGGHWVPELSHRVWQGGAEAAPLKGILIGNGLVDPEEQYKWYPDMAKDGGKSEGGSLKTGVITSPVTQGIMKAAVGPCIKAIETCNDYNSSLQGAACSSAFVLCNYGETVPYQLTGYNPYDMRIKCEVPPLCYNFSSVETYLNTPSVQKAIGASKKWGSCNLLVNKAFQNDFLKNYHTKIPDLLKSGIRVMVYAGDVDYICNWLGNKKWTLALDWPHKADFNAAEDKPYMLQDGKTQLGRVRQSNGFSFVQVYQAGHMVPMDQPEAALTMLNDFLGDKLGGDKTVVV
jgi:cathepsin A (carboxypeptidase C)